MVDTNIVIDLRERSHWFDWSMARVAEAVTSASVIVVGELAYRTGTLVKILDMLDGFEIVPVPLTVEAGFRAGLAHRAYRTAGAPAKSCWQTF